MRARLRDLGFSIGHFPVGTANAITDVGGVRVGHTTLVIGEGPLEVGKGPAWLPAALGADAHRSAAAQAHARRLVAAVRTAEESGAPSS